MVILNLEDGTSKKFDLQAPADLANLNSLGSNAVFMARVRAIWLSTNQTETLPMPKGFRRFRLWADLITSKGGQAPRGERVVMQADDISVALTAYYGPAPRMTRVDVQRTGKLRWAPEQEGGRT
jgi:hypothetical protein